MAFTEQPYKVRTDEEIKDALEAIKREVIRAEFQPILIHYTVIIDALKELLKERERK